MTAHQCLRTFISISEKKASSKSSIMLGQAIINAVIPTVVTHTLNYKFSGENISKEDSTLSILEEDIKTLVMLPNTVPENQKKMILSVILPTLTAMLDTPPFDNTLSPIHTVTILHLLALATTMPQVFKSTVAELPEHVRAKLEASVRYSVVLSQQIQQEQKQQELQRKTTYTEDIKQPTIHLKTNFSNFS
ncbi:hypothetical protein BDF14DRAFT_1074175 [Spinellus fusiger]|nr:hypothetical protein BDF14DRAFT_1074175 [Spinellus fusiger]